MKGWWFSGADATLRYGDGRTAAVGATHEHDGPIEMCESGLHASVKPLDALNYAPLVLLRAWRVTLSGEVVRGDDKVVATRRTYLAACDADPVLRHFARLCALDVVHLWEAPGVVLRYLRTGDEGIRDAAGDAAGDAAWAARAAAGAAARDAACDAAREKQNRRLSRMLREACKA